MNEKVLWRGNTSPFTAHYTVQTSDGSKSRLTCRTVHTCPSCGLRRLIIWNDDNSMLFADLVFGFRETKNGVLHVQSYCRSCRSRVSSSVFSEIEVKNNG